MPPTSTSPLAASDVRCRARGQLLTGQIDAQAAARTGFSSTVSPAKVSKSLRDRELRFMDATSWRPTERPVKSAYSAYEPRIAENPVPLYERLLRPEVPVAKQIHRGEEIDLIAKQHQAWKKRALDAFGPAYAPPAQMAPPSPFPAQFSPIRTQVPYGSAFATPMPAHARQHAHYQMQPANYSQSRFHTEMSYHVAAAAASAAAASASAAAAATLAASGAPPMQTCMCTNCPFSQPAAMPQPAFASPIPTYQQFYQQAPWQAAAPEPRAAGFASSPSSAFATRLEPFTPTALAPSDPQSPPVRTSSNRPTEPKTTSDLSSLVSILSVSSNGTDSRNGGDLFESNDQSGMYLFRGMHPDAMSPLPPSSPFPVRKEISAGSTAAPALPQQA